MTAPKIVKLKSGSIYEEKESYSRLVCIDNWILVSNTAGRNYKTREISPDPVTVTVVAGAVPVGVAAVVTGAILLAVVVVPVAAVARVRPRLIGIAPALGSRRQGDRGGQEGGG